MENLKSCRNRFQRKGRISTFTNLKFVVLDAIFIKLFVVNNLKGIIDINIKYNLNIQYAIKIEKKMESIQ